MFDPTQFWGNQRVFLYLIRSNVGLCPAIIPFQCQFCILLVFALYFVSQCFVYKIEITTMNIINAAFICSSELRVWEEKVRGEKKNEGKTKDQALIPIISQIHSHVQCSHETKWKWVMERTELKAKKAFPFSFQTMVMSWWAKFISHFNEYQKPKNETYWIQS